MQTFPSEHPFGGFQRQIFGLCFVIVLFDSFDTSPIGCTAPSLIKEWNVPLGSADAVVFGVLMDRFTTRSTHPAGDSA